MPPMKKRIAFAATFILIAGLVAGRAGAAEAPPTEGGCSADVTQGKAVTILNEGRGPDVILIPGLSTPRAVWDATAARLKAYYRLHIVQVRGFGDAPGPNAEGAVLPVVVEDVRGFIEDCIVGQDRPAPAVIGHSMGGLTAMIVAARAPEKVGKLMVVDSLPFAGMMFGPTATVASVAPRAEAIQKILAAQSNAEADDGILEYQSATDAGRAQVRAWTRTADAKVAAQLMYDVMTTDLRPELGAIAAPFTMLYPFDAALADTPSRAIPTEMIDALYKAAFASAKTVTLKRVDGSRHFIMLDQPDAFAKAVDEFLAQ
jgi:pimeloyl-ACP methyl ester carboxylesterase